MPETTQEQHHVKVEPFERDLLVKLTDKEKAELAERTAHLLSEIDQKKDDKKNAAKQSQAQIDELQAELNRVTGEFRAGTKYQKVKCERHYLFRVGNLKEIRTDTGATLAERGLTERERQLELGGVDTKASDAKGDAPLPTEKPKKKGGGRKKKAD